MGTALKVLLIEDSEDDALLNLGALRKGGYDPEYARVQDKHGLLQALSQSWDVILCDYVLPSFTALHALAIYQEAGLDIPFIVVSGNIGEDIAVGAMKAGAHDYIMKNNLARLVPAVSRELKEAAERRRGRLAEEDLKLAKFALDQAADLVAWFDAEGNIFYVNDATCALLGYPREQLLMMNLKSFSRGDDPEGRWRRFMDDLMKNGSKTQEAVLPAANGDSISVEISTRFLKFQGRDYICGIARDISERKQAERFRQELAEERDKLLEQLKSVLEQMPIGCILSNANFEVSFWNPAAEKIFGYSGNEMLGKISHETITPSTLHPLLRSIKDKMRNGDGVSHNINENITKDGRSILCEWHDVSLTNSDGLFVGHLAMAEDITERKKNEDEIVRHTARVESLLRVASRLNASQLDLHTVLEMVCKEVQNVLGAFTVTVSFYDEVSDTLSRATGIGLLGDLPARPITRQVFDSIFQNEVEIVSDIQTIDPLPYPESMKKASIHTAMFAAMKNNKEFIGCINAFYTGPPRSISEDERKMMKGLADQAALAIANARLFEEIKAGRERMRHLNAQVLTAQEEERRRLSRELHDEAGQSLTALKIYLELIQGDLPGEFSSIRLRLDEAAALAGATLEQIRLLAQGLRPPALDTLGLNAALEDHCREFSRRTHLPIIYCGTEISFRHDAINICLYRFLQEALTNIAKHAQANKVNVHLSMEGNEFTLSIADDGQGFKEDALNGSFLRGVGLMGMRERIEALNGRLYMESQPGQGTRLTAVIPMEEST